MTCQSFEGQDRRSSKKKASSCFFGITPRKSRQKNPKTFWVTCNFTIQPSSRWATQTVRDLLAPEHFRTTSEPSGRFFRSSILPIPCPPSQTAECPGYMRHSMSLVHPLPKRQALRTDTKQEVLSQRTTLLETTTNTWPVSERNHLTHSCVGYKRL